MQCLQSSYFYLAEFKPAILWNSSKVELGVQRLANCRLTRLETVKRFECLGAVMCDEVKSEIPSRIVQITEAHIREKKNSVTSETKLMYFLVISTIICISESYCRTREDNLGLRNEMLLCTSENINLEHITSEEVCNPIQDIISFHDISSPWSRQMVV